MMTSTATNGGIRLGRMLYTPNLNAIFFQKKNVRLEWSCGQRLTKNVSFVSSARDFYRLLLHFSVFLVYIWLNIQINHSTHKLVQMFSFLLSAASPLLRHVFSRRSLSDEEQVMTLVTPDISTAQVHLFIHQLLGAQLQQQVK